MDKTGTQSIFLITSILVVLMAATVIVLFVVFQRRKVFFLQKEKENKKRFEREIAESQVEIREETLRNISWELHDNIGQLLTLAKIQLQSSEGTDDVRETIGKSLEELRALSKSINPEAIKNMNLAEAIQLEIDRFNRLNFIESTLKVKGNKVELDKNHNIIIFRMLQEFFSNTIKHSKASELCVALNFTESVLEIKTKDNGIGFVLDDVLGKGIGIGNIKNRAKLIGANAYFKSAPKKGTTLIINYPYKS